MQNQHIQMCNLTRTLLDGVSSFLAQMADASEGAFWWDY